LIEQDSSQTFSFWQSVPDIERKYSPYWVYRQRKK
jgi:hypothetical protein